MKVGHGKSGREERKRKSKKWYMMVDGGWCMVWYGMTWYGYMDTWGGVYNKYRIGGHACKDARIQAGKQARDRDEMGWDDRCIDDRCIDARDREARK
jgi:hypothetical protein